MALTIKIDWDEDDREDMAHYLRTVADRVENNWDKGYGWELTGTDESEESEEEGETVSV